MQRPRLLAGLVAGSRGRPGVRRQGGHGARHRVAAHRGHGAHRRRAETLYILDIVDIVDSVYIVDIEHIVDTVDIYR